MSTFQHSFECYKICFGTWIDADGHWADSVHFPQVALQYPFRGKGGYHLRGRVCEEYGVYSIEVSYMEKLGIKARTGMLIKTVLKG